MAHRFRSKYKHLGNPAKPMITDIDCDWISYLSKGGLMMPCDTLIHVSRIMEACFLNFHGDTDLSEEQYIFQKVVKLTQSQLTEDEKKCVPYDALHLLARTRTYIRLRFLNRDAIKNKTKFKKLYKNVT